MYRTREAQGWREKRVVVSSSKKMKSTRFRGGWLRDTGPSPRRREGGGAFFKVGGMRGRPGVQNGSRRLVACQHHDVLLVPRDRWIYTLSSPFHPHCRAVISARHWYPIYPALIPSKSSLFLVHLSAVNFANQIIDPVKFRFRVCRERARIFTHMTTTIVRAF